MGPGLWQWRAVRALVALLFGVCAVGGSVHYGSVSDCAESFADSGIFVVLGDHGGSYDAKWATWSFGGGIAGSGVWEGETGTGSPASWAITHHCSLSGGCADAVRWKHGWGVSGCAENGTEISFGSLRGDGRRAGAGHEISCAGGGVCWFVAYIDDRLGSLAWVNVVGGVENGLEAVQLASRVGGKHAEGHCGWEEEREGRKEELERGANVCAIGGRFMGRLTLGEMDMVSEGEESSIFLCLLQAASGRVTSCEVITCKGWPCEAVEWSQVNGGSALSVSVFAWLSDSVIVKRLTRRGDSSISVNDRIVGLDALTDSGRFTWRRELPVLPWWPERNVTASPTPTVGTNPQPTASTSPSVTMLVGPSSPVYVSEESIASTVAVVNEVLEAISVVAGVTFIVLCWIITASFLLIRWQVRRHRDLEQELQFRDS